MPSLCIDVKAVSPKRADPKKVAPSRRSPVGPIATWGARIPEAIRGELGRREITRYELWKRARVHCPTLPESAVYEFLRGVRAIGLDYVEALLAAVDLEVRRREEAAPGAR